MALQTGAGTAKEQTILGLSQEIREILCDFQSKLDNHFKRAIKEESTGKDRPEYGNVLDEIIENLSEDEAWLQRIVSFISSEVLPKIN